MYYIIFDILYLYTPLSVKGNSFTIFVVEFAGWAQFSSVVVADVAAPPSVVVSEPSLSFDTVVASLPPS
jgi:hypothetical protein